MSNAVTLEPIVGFSLDNNTTSTTAGGTTVESKTSTRDLTLAAQVRVAAAQSGPVDLVVIAGAGLSSQRTVVDPDGADNNTTTDGLGMGLNWGIGVNFWATENGSVSADASNPLLGIGSTTTTDEATSAETTSGGSQLAVAFDPTVRIMGHVFF